MICIGKFAGAHGVKGVIKVLSYCEDAHLLEKSSEFRMKIHGQQGKHILVEVEGITDREAAQELKGREIFIERSSLPEPGEEEYYLEDLKGMDARDTEGSPCGKIVSVQDFGASPLLEIRPTSGETYFIPFTKEFVPEVNIVEGFVAINPFEIT